VEFVSLSSAAIAITAAAGSVQRYKETKLNFSPLTPLLLHGSVLCQQPLHGLDYGLAHSGPE
jgi:hypothetical protein